MVCLSLLFLSMLASLSSGSFPWGFCLMDWLLFNSFQSGVSCLLASELITSSWSQLFSSGEGERCRPWVLSAWSCLSGSARPRWSVGHKQFLRISIPDHSSLWSWLEQEKNTASLQTCLNTVKNNNAVQTKPAKESDSGFIWVIASAHYLEITALTLFQLEEKKRSPMIDSPR